MTRFRVCQRLLAAIAAYNAGFQGAANQIKSHELAAVVAPGTYAGKVLARAAFYASKGFEAASPKPAVAAQAGMFIATNTALRAVYRFKTGRGRAGEFPKNPLSHFQLRQKPGCTFRILDTIRF